VIALVILVALFVVLAVCGVRGWGVDSREGAPR
jgi:hypothetical protein